MDRFSFGSSNERGFKLGLILSFFSVILIPAIAVLLIRGTKLISSIDMPDNKQRIAPLLATCLFYIWYYVNVAKNISYPTTIAMISLGGSISVALAFFINIFSKISLHAIGAAAMTTGMGILMFLTSESYFDLSLLFYGTISVSSIFVFLCSVFLLGLICTSRLALGKHKFSDITGGVIVGVLSMLIAFRIYY